MKKNEQFIKLIKDVRLCTLCERMNDRPKIIGHSSGNLDAKILFIGEAPGRLGADNTGIPFHGDTSGHNFEKLLASVGLRREEIFVTNAVLCNPRCEKGNNAPPNTQEIKNCSINLEKQINLINPKIIVTLGAQALKSLYHIEKHNIQLKKDVRKKHNWGGYILIPTYHPGQRAMLHRSYANQQSDYKFIVDTMKQAGIKKRKSYGKINNSTADLLEVLFQVKPYISYFALHKIAYLAEYNFFKKYNYRFSSAYFIRQKDGPYCTDLHIQKITNTFSDIRKSIRNKKIFLEKRETDLFDQKPENTEDRTRMKKIILSLSEKDDAKLKNSAYMSKPMRNILKKEKDSGLGQYNAPIEFDNHS